jgi:hypothetical protein
MTCRLAIIAASMACVFAQVVDAEQAVPAEQLRPEALKLLEETPNDGKVAVTVEVRQDLGDHLRTEIYWDGQTQPEQLKQGEPSQFRLTPGAHALRVRAKAPPLENQAFTTIELQAGKPHAVEVRMEPRFTGSNIRVVVFRGPLKISDEFFPAPAP